MGSSQETATRYLVCVKSVLVASLCEKCVYRLFSSLLRKTKDFPLEGLTTFSIECQVCFKPFPVGRDHTLLLGSIPTFSGGFP